MTQFDSLRLGQGEPVGSQTEQGVQVVALRRVSYTPGTAFTTNLATAQTPSAAGNLTLTAGTNITTTTIGSTTYYELDVPRTLAFEFTASSTETDFTITALDKYKVPVVETVTVGAGAGTTRSTKAVKWVATIAAGSGTTSSVTVGVSSAIGFPVRADDFSDVILSYSGGLITANTGFTAADTNTATATTGDTRGTYVVQSAPNGTKKLVMYVVAADIDSTEGIYGVTQYGG